MAFSWVQDVSVGASIDAADVNEIKTSLDSIYTALGITRTGCASGAGWTELPVSVGESITSTQFQEMRSVTDYAYDNKCPGYCANQDTGYQSGYQAGVDSSYCPGYYNNENSGYLNDYDTGAYRGENVTYCSTDLGGRHLSGYNLNEKSSYNTSALYNDHGTYCSTDLGGRNLSGYNLNQKSSYNISAKSVNWVGY